jgi:hypothetical protein
VDRIAQPDAAAGGVNSGRLPGFARQVVLAGSYHCPAVIQGHDGTLHAIYSCFIASDEPVAKPGEERKGPRIVAKGIKHAAFNEAWIRSGD